MNKTWLNWKVLVGLGAAGGIGLYSIAPNLVASTLPILALAACPLAMLLTMKGMHGIQGEAHGRQAPQETDAALTHEEQMARLRRQQADLADRIAALERDEPGSANAKRRRAPAKQEPSPRSLYETNQQPVPEVRKLEQENE